VGGRGWCRLEQNSITSAMVVIVWRVARLICCRVYVKYGTECVGIKEDKLWTIDQRYISTNTSTQYLPLHSTISDLFSLSTNHNSLILQHYHHLLPQIAQLSCPLTTPRTDLSHYFLTTLSPHSARGSLKKHCAHTVKSELYNHMFDHECADFHLLPGIPFTHTSHPFIGMSRSAIKHCLSPLSFLICTRRKLHLPIYPPNTHCTCGHHDHDVFGDHTYCCDKGSKKRTHNTIATDFATILSPVLAQARYIYPNTKLDIETHLHLQSDPTA